MSLPELIEAEIIEAITKYNAHVVLPSAAIDLLSMGELIDRLSIVNYKLYDLKNQVMKNQDKEKFLAVAAIKDVALVEERARLKRAIDEKLIAMITNPNYNPEIKSYGTDYKDEQIKMVVVEESFLYERE